MPDIKAHSSQMVATDAIGQSEAFLDFQDKLSRVAPVNRPVLLLGERGTGKELAAIRLHYLSLRWQEPLVALNCAALSPALIETELFGHEKGAFTGAEHIRQGRFEAADGGTLFLDEIGMIPLETQEKILRVVEYGTFERVGASKAIEVDVRIVSATNADLLKLTRENKFKRDLLDRLSFEVLFLPPLRERHGDIALMADHFARRMAFELGWEAAPAFSEDVRRKLNSAEWKGNVRELKNVIERAVYRSESPLISQVDLDPFLSPYTPAGSQADTDRIESVEQTEHTYHPVLKRQPIKTAVRNLEISLLKEALKSARYNQKKAAEILGLSYDQFRGLKRKYQKDL